MPVTTTLPGWPRINSTAETSAPSSLAAARAIASDSIRMADSAARSHESRSACDAMESLSSHAAPAPRMWLAQFHFIGKQPVTLNDAGDGDLRFEAGSLAVDHCPSLLRVL